MEGDGGAYRVGISGHRGLGRTTASLVSDAIRKILSGLPDSLAGISCLADGADQIFARELLARGGTLEVVVPAGRYKDCLPPDAHAEYDALLARASRVHRLPYPAPTEESHMAASRLMLDRTHELLAVWDGKPARGYGGTADVVAEARSRGLPIRVIWPPGARRD
ncbi:hypothetical protein [Bailinhaonella thermotolerans]|uniref:DNA recombination-mediator protein A n=1 Tax=Bailinhaonella thermotolerans TaxID=1070861 RepID=A0A3A4AUN8_9ACTN|nr:hypothetical protein [Bailinhaonella thermotolerans]RJL32421.1 hypothetical protein D5H75_12825 [Bailinhaonella thermotolerans]